MKFAETAAAVVRASTGRSRNEQAFLPAALEIVETPVTPRHFLTYRDEQASAADGTYWIYRIPRPILVLRDEADGVVLPFEPYMLLSAAQTEGSLVPSIKYVLLPNNRPPSREGHIFTDNTEALTDAVATWLGEQQL